MSGTGYKIANKTELHFITYAVVEWVDVFTIKEYRDILLGSIRYGQRKRFTALWMVHYEQPCSFEIKADVFQYRNFINTLTLYEILNGYFLYY